MANSGRTILVCCAAIALLAGCHSPWVETTLVNQQDTPVKLVEVTYPGGTFGVQTIAAHGSYHYRFRILNTAQMNLDFTDAAGHEHSANGPALQPGQEGRLEIDISSGNSVAWQTHLSTRR